MFLRSIVQNGEAVGVVWFSTSATVKTGLTTINDTTRMTLLNSIPRDPSGSTSIGAGKTTSNINILVLLCLSLQLPIMYICLFKHCFVSDYFLHY